MPRTLESLLESTYDDEEIRQVIGDEAIKWETADRILSGELVLPHPVDAKKHVDRIKGRVPGTPDSQQTAARISALEQLVQELQEKEQSPDVKRMQLLEKRIHELESAGGH